MWTQDQILLSDLGSIRSAKAAKAMHGVWMYKPFSDHKICISPFLFAFVTEKLS